jgi:hypothetical protein
VRGWLSSPRKRRRIFRVGALAALVGGVAAAMIAWPNTADSPKVVYDTTPVTITPEPSEVKPSRTDLIAARQVAARFVVTAMARQHLDETYTMVTPGLREGLSLDEWKGGNIPVPTYPIDQLGQARERLSFAYKDDIGLDVLIIPTHDSKLRSMVFAAELRARGRGKARRWLVDSWNPVSASGGSAPGTGDVVAAGRPALGAAWLLVPAGILGLIVLVPIGLGVRGWYRNNRAQRSYSSTSRPS